MKTEAIKRLINAVDFWVACGVFDGTNFNPNTDDAKTELEQLALHSVSQQHELLFCGGCGDKLTHRVETDINSPKICRNKLCKQKQKQAIIDIMKSDEELGLYEDNRTELQKEFEAQTPTIKGVGRIEYLQTFVTWLHLQVEKARGQSLPIDDVSGCVLPSEEESDQEAYRRHSPTKHVIDYDMGCYRGWQECYNWIEEKLSNC